MPTVFVTGATGFVGRALCAAMLEKGWKVKASIRKKSVPDFMPAGVEIVLSEGLEDRRDYCRDLKGVDVVIHLAARVHVMKDVSADPLEAFRKVNVQGTECLARSASRAGVKIFIFLSSVKVNGEGSLEPYTENTVPVPQDPYGISKWEAEKALADITAQAGLKTVIVRSPLVYGAGVRANFGNLIKIVKSGIPLPFKSVNNRRSFIYIGNLVDVLLTCATHPAAAGHTFMVSDGQDISTPELIRMIAAAMKRKEVLFSVSPSFLRGLAQMSGKSEEAERLLGSLFVDIRKITKTLDWKPPFNLESGIRETVRCLTSS
jgi:nucleoside-diphosphate-sugar epimerase